MRYNTTAHGVNTSGASAFNLWSAEDQLFFRDDSFLQQKTPSGNPVFWARGNGWAFAAMARTLDALPPVIDDSRLVWHPCFASTTRLSPSGLVLQSRAADRAEYGGKLQLMAAKLKQLQGADGCWRSSLEDPTQFPSIETSGTSLFVFGLAWAVNHGLLTHTEYGAAAAKGWSSHRR